MRDPIMRAFSEWSMFTTWGWDKGTCACPATRARRRPRLARAPCHACASARLADTQRAARHVHRSFLKRVTGQMTAFKRCNESLFHKPELLNALPDHGGAPPRSKERARTANACCRSREPPLHVRAAELHAYVRDLT